MSKTTAAPKSAVSKETETKTPDYGYLAEKDPSSLHHALKAFIEDHNGPEVDIKTIQAVLSAHGTFQKSEYNKNREDYKPRTAASIYKGGVTTSKNFEWVVNPETGESERVEVQTEEAPKEVEAPKTETKAPARRTRKAPAKTETKVEAPKAPARRTRKPAAAAK